MNDIDLILTVVENPTRRRILESLARGSGYPLQLSRELGVSPQAVMKNLSVLEGAGVVERRREAGGRGPDRMVYRLMSEFSVTIDLRNGMFRAEAPELEIMPDASPMEAMGGLREAMERISQIDEKIADLDSARAEALRERSAIIGALMGGAPGLAPLARAVLHEMLDGPGRGVGEMSERLMRGERLIREAMAEIEEAFKERDRDGE